MNTEIITKNGNTYTFTRKKYLDVNGNPLYFVHYLDLGLDKYESTKLTRKAGLRKFTGKEYGGGFTFQSYNIADHANFFESLGLFRKPHNY